MEPRKLRFTLTVTVLLILSLIITGIFLIPRFFKKQDLPFKGPQLTCIMVVDQLAYHYIKKLRPYFKYGFKELLDNGTFYTQAHHPHGVPETTTGHHALSTGARPKDHGGVFNDWINDQYENEKYEEDNDPNAAVLKNGETLMPGKSSKKTMVDSISDQFILGSQANRRNMVYALSLKSYPAIATATKKGKAIWFDDHNGGFTSSKAYYKEVPEWVRGFNHKHQFSAMTEFSWPLSYDESSPAYNFPYIKNYDYAAYDFTMAGQQSIQIDRSNPIPYRTFLQSPTSSNVLLDLAKICVDENFRHGSDRMLLWILLSNLDLISHYYGPDSLEVIDTIYHLDWQIKQFMEHVKNRLGSDKILFVLTADHGIPPIPEIAQKKGFSFARRVHAPPLIEQMNKLVKEKYHVNDVVNSFEPTYFKLNNEILATLSNENRENLLEDLKKFLMKQEGIRKVWTKKELEKTPYHQEQHEFFYKTQIYENRIGELICMPHPYCLITNYPTGTSHSTPYAYDTHVPLIFYQKGTFEKKEIDDKVWIPQVPVTLSHLLRIQPPSASSFPLLPGVDW